jgi:hypothetical protein
MITFANLGYYLASEAFEDFTPLKKFSESSD